MYKVYFVNFNYDSANKPSTIEEAKKVAKQAGFQSIVIKEENDEVVGSFDPIIGWRNY